MKKLKCAVALVAGLSVANCASLNDFESSSAQSFCAAEPGICVLLGLAVVGGVVGIVAAASDRSNNGRTPQSIFNPLNPEVLFSDAALKRDVRYLKTMPNGIRLHSFKYLDDNRTFVGVIAQELLADARFSSAVQPSGGGYLAVDYSALGLKIIASGEMKDAGQKAFYAFQARESL